MKTVAVLLITEVLLTALVSVIAGWTHGVHYAWSAWVGGGICIVTTAYFAMRVFMVKGDATASEPAPSAGSADPQAEDHEAQAPPVAGRMVRAFYLAEGQKLILTAVCFIAVIKLLDVAFAPLIIAYVIAHFGYWVVMLLSVNWTPTKTA